MGGREELVERGIENGRGKEGDLYIYREREGLRGNEIAYCVEKETENGRGRGEGGDPTCNTNPPTHTCMYVCPYITS